MCIKIVLKNIGNYPVSVVGGKTTYLIGFQMGNNNIYKKAFEQDGKMDVLAERHNDDGGLPHQSEDSSKQ